jgi:hypothetical protein
VQRLGRGLTCLGLVICYALVVLLVPSSAWSADTGSQAFSRSSSLSAGWSLDTRPLTLTPRRLDPTPTDSESPPPSPEPTPSEPTDPAPSPPLEPSPSPEASPPSPSEPPTFSDEQLQQLDTLAEPGDPTCGSGELPPCEVRLATGQWETVNEGLVAAVVALSVLLLVALIALLGSWGHRE